MLLAGIKTADFAIYETLRLWRVPNTRHGGTGLFKIPLATNELFTFNIESIRELARERRSLEFPDDHDWHVRPGLQELWRKTAFPPRPKANRLRMRVIADPRVPSIEPIISGCSWLRHCRDDAATLSEPEWFAMLSIVSRCANGEAVAHQWSAPYPGYSPEETTKKLKHAIEDGGPRTCVNIHHTLGGEPYCSICPLWGAVKSPIVLGRHSGSSRSQREGYDRILESPLFRRRRNFGRRR